MLATHELQLLLYNGNPSMSPVGEMWKKIRTLLAMEQPVVNKKAGEFKPGH